MYIILALVGLITEATAQWVVIPNQEPNRPSWALELEQRLADRDTLDVLIEFRVSPTVQSTPRGTRERATTERAAAEAVAETMRRHVEDAVRPAADELRSQGLDVTHVYTYQPIVRATIRPADLPSLMARDDILAVHMNDYNKVGNEYSSVNKDAMADGDSLGRGTGTFLDVYNTAAGTIEDVVERKNEIKINKFNQSKVYPDF